jgi:hypothetical protein
MAGCAVATSFGVDRSSLYSLYHCQYQISHRVGSRYKENSQIVRVHFNLFSVVNPIADGTVEENTLFDAVDGERGDLFWQSWEDRLVDWDEVGV